MDRVDRGEIDRLLIMIPPQFGKSTIASKGYPASSLGRDPTHDFLSISATAELANDFGREVRDKVASQECSRVFPGLQLAADNRAAGRWKTGAGGSYYAVGIGGSLFGRGATRALIDDPFASWEDAQSDRERERVWEWYRGTLYNRVRPGGAIVVIAHRLHEADLIGRLLERQKAGGDKWEIVELPAIIDGEPLWPERYDLKSLERIRVNTSPIKWSALYLQNPMPEEGTFFKREWFEFYDPAKVKNVHKYTTGDFAVTDQAGDFTDIATHGYSDEGLYLAMEGWYGQETADVWIDRLCEQIGRHKPLCFFGESGPIRRAIEPFLARRMRESRVNCRLEWLVRTHDKPTMARPLQGLAAMRKVKLPDTEYGQRLLRTLLSFPGGQIDDPVDMAALMGMAIDQAHPAMMSPPKPAGPQDRYKPVHDEEEVRDWRVA